MKTKYKKLTVAVHAAIMTSLICSAVPTFASDVELYKAPQSSETTIMFMMDVSGSMAEDNRLTNLIRGMKKLLQGDVASGIEPLPDKLVTGLAEFSSINRNGPFGRIKLEARPLGSSTNLGIKELYKVTYPNALYSGTRTQTRTQTSNQIQTHTSTENQTRTITRTERSYREQYRWRGSWYWDDWSDWAAVPGTTIQSQWGGSGFSTSSNWSNSGTASGWSNSAESTGSESISLTKGEPVVQQCIDWNSDISCKTWENSVLTLEQVEGKSTLYNTNDEYSMSWGNNTWENVGEIEESFSPSTSSDRDSNERNGSYSYGAETPYFCGDRCEERRKIGTRIDTKTVTRTETRTLTQRRNQKRIQTGQVNGKQVNTYTGTAYDTHRNKMVRAVNALRANGGTPTGYAYAEVAAYLMGQTTAGVSSAGAASGFVADQTNISGSSAYEPPSSVTSTKQCNTQGIYFLTDGAPTYYQSQNNVPDQYKKSVLEEFMKKALGPDKGADFSCSNDSTLGKYTSGYSWTNDTSQGASRMLKPNGWDCIGAFTKALLNKDDNPAGVSIKTAVVGFGSDFSNKATSDEKDADKWGELGQGGSYIGTNDQDVINSVIAFLKKLQKYIPPVTTGSVTVPVDNLDTQNIQPWGYFPQFDPQPDSRVTTWIGNLKKYEVKNNILRDRNNNKVVDDTTGISVDDPNDFWADTSIKKIITKIKIVDGQEVEEDIEVKVGGALSQLKLGLTDTNIERKIFTDRKINEDGTIATVGDNSNLLQVKTADLKVLNDTNNFVKDPKRGYLAALFGYDISSAMARQLETSNPSSTAQTTFTNFLTNTNATLRQMGAVMHSKPLLITQEGKTKFDAATGDLSYESRDDLIVFGTTQGLLHVVRAGKNSTDSDAGKEVFTFVPSEMIEKQHQGFLDQKQQGIDLKYGIDGPWTAYTEYATRSGSTANEPVVSVKNGKQWLYGGLRMGGQSYYALDFSDVTSTSGTPKIKFRIDPKSAAAFSPMSYMGQSWSKPTLTWVKWKGGRKLVMLVGGGYDTAYESLSHRPTSSTDKGAGVYMFDADDGSLLWWASSNVSSTSAVDATKVSNMQRSVVSQIKAIDRNNDGLTDHLYFGDLGGQLWRVDLDSSNAAGDTANVAKRVVRILDMSSASKVPRFYSTPSFSIHNSGNGLFGVVTIGSGNLSFPMSESDQSDALYVVYDKDVTKRNLSVLKDSELSTVDVSTSGAGGKKLIENTNGNTSTSLTNGGWYYPLATKNRILNDNVVIANDLYTSVFDATVDIDDVNCYGGVRGKSVAKQFCLPFGQCLKKDDSGNDVSDERPDDIDLGLGNIGISFGGVDKKRGLVLNLPTTKTLKSYQGKTKFISQRWYER